MRSLYSFLFIIVSFLTTSVAQQVEFKENIFNVPLSATTDVSKIEADFMPSLLHLEMPTPDGKSEREKLYKIKEELKKNGNLRSSYSMPVPLNGEDPVILNGVPANIFNGIPNDNDLSISNDGKVISVVNSSFYAYDAVQNQSLASASLAAFAAPLGIPNHKYDPKTAYDPVADRFVLVFLNGSVDTASRIILAFSKTNDPSGEWNLYSLPGNPFGNTTWSDYPMIALTKNELFLTVNAIYTDSSWQSGFQQSYIWQIGTAEGYAGNGLTTKLYTDIKYGGKSIRNLAPIKGGSTLYGPEFYFLSNRNFSPDNDSIFMVKITNTIANFGKIQIKLGKSDIRYGVPPAARQFAGHQFDTNDGRILGGFIENNKIQFVANTHIPSTGFSGIYHGIIEDIDAPNFEVKGALIGDTLLDLGYPNISYSGLSAGDDDAIITALHTAPSVYAGFSTIYYNPVGQYSRVNYLKEGENYVNALPWSLERWGDYTGSQRKYNEPGKVWASGSYGVYKMGTPNRVTNSWISEIARPLGANVEYVKNEKSYSVYPNPFNERINLEFDLPETAISEITIFDMQGKTVQTLYLDKIKKGKNLFSFSPEPLAPGTYIVTVKSEKELIFQQKIVKQ